MSPEPLHRHDTPSAPPAEDASSRAARAANILVGVTIAVLLIALAAVVALA
jgi:hypothetical protein